MRQNSPSTRREQAVRLLVVDMAGAHKTNHPHAGGMGSGNACHAILNH